MHTYNDYWKQEYLAHGKWGFTNGIPNGKKKAKNLLKAANKLRNKAGRAIENTADNIYSHLGYEPAKAVAYKRANREMIKIAKTYDKNGKVNPNKNPVNTTVVNLNGKAYTVKTSSKAYSAAKKFYNDSYKTGFKYGTTLVKEGKQHSKDNSKVITDAYANAKKMDKKYKKQTLDSLLQGLAYTQHKDKEKAIIKKAKEVDKLRFPKKKKG